MTYDFQVFKYKNIKFHKFIVVVFVVVVVVVVRSCKDQLTYYAIKDEALTNNANFQ